MKATNLSTNAPIITSPEFAKLDGVKHGFFTRNGGVSEGIYSSLNVGLGSNDLSENVKANREIAMRSFGNYNADIELLDGCQLHTLYQIHSDKVITVNDAFEGRVEADALVTKKPNTVLGILTADCTPVLFADPIAKVVGAAHAGWKGACGGILENTVSAMVELGAKAENIHAAIGPTIAQKSYEVGADFYDRFIGFSADNSKFFIPSVKNGHYMFDLPAFVKSRLNALNIAAVSDVQRDTCAEAETFFSYRRSCLNKEADYGRNLSVISVC